MSAPNPSNLSAARPPPPAGPPGSPVAPPRTGGAPAPGGLGGRARSFREAQSQRRSDRRERLGVFLVVVILVGALLTVATYHPFGSSPYNFPPPGPTIVVHLGTSSTGEVTCGLGGTAYTERIPWTNSTRPLTSGEVYVRLYEIGDGDAIGDPSAVANATPTNPCGGAPPDTGALWYLVLVAPSGTNLLTFTVDGGWASVAPGPSNIPIENASALILVTNESLAGTGRGLGVYGFVNDTSITGSTLL